MWGTLGFFGHLLQVREPNLHSPATTIAELGARRLILRHLLGLRGACSLCAKLFLQTLTFQAYASGSQRLWGFMGELLFGFWAPQGVWESLRILDHR